MEETIKIIELYKSGLGLNQIAKIVHRGVPFIKDALICEGIKIKSNSHSASKRNTELNYEQKKIIEGLLLGDGSIIRQKRDRTAKLSVKTIEKVFADHILKSFPLDIKIYSYAASHRIIKGKECCCKENYKIESKVDNALNEFRNKWYRDGVKIIPLDLDISPTSVKYWFYGDGNSSFIREKNGVALTFYTNGFTFIECEFLQKQLREKIGINFHVNHDRGKPILKVSTKKAVYDFFEYIGECNVSCYDYKWKFPEVN